MGEWCWGAREGVFWEDFPVKESQVEGEASGRWRTKEQHSREREQQGKGLEAANSVAFLEDDAGGESTRETTRKAEGQVFQRAAAFSRRRLPCTLEHWSDS